MAYQYKSALVRGAALDARWQSADLADRPLKAVFADSHAVYLTLTHPSVETDLVLDLTAYRTQIPSRALEQTVRQWLASLGTRSLPVLDGLPDLREYTVGYGDAWAAGYSIEPVDRRRPQTENLPLSERNDLLLRKPGVNFSALWDQCMVSVNGLFHRVGGAPEGMYVVDGARSGRIANDNHVGVLSFRQVGKLDYIPIRRSMLYKTHRSQRYAEQVNIELPYDVFDKTVLLVIGGYLHLLDRTYLVTGPRSLRIDFNNYPLIERLFQSRERINLDSLGLEERLRNPDQVALSQLFDDETITRYLLLPQSFIVVLNTDAVFLRRHHPEKTKLPGRYLTAPQHRAWPLFGDLGQLLEYRAFDLDGQRVLASRPSRDMRYNFQTTDRRPLTSVDNLAYSADPWTHARTQLIEFGRYR